MEAIENLNEPMGSHRTTISNYIVVCILLLFLFLSGTKTICFMVCGLSTNEHPYCVLLDNVACCCLVSYLISFDAHFCAISAFFFVSQRYYIVDRLSYMDLMF